MSCRHQNQPVAGEVPSLQPSELGIAQARAQPKVDRAPLAPPSGRAKNRHDLALCEPRLREPAGAADGASAAPDCPCASPLPSSSRRSSRASTGSCPACSRASSAAASASRRPDPRIRGRGSQRPPHAPPASPDSRPPRRASSGAPAPACQRCIDPSPRRSAFLHCRTIVGRCQAQRLRFALRLFGDLAIPSGNGRPTSSAYRARSITGMYVHLAPVSLHLSFVELWKTRMRPLCPSV